MPSIIDRPTVNGVLLVTRDGKQKSRYSAEERLQILGATQADLNATIKLFCPDGPLYAATRRDSEDPRAWMTPRGRLPDSEVLRHLTGNLTPGIKPRWVAPHSWEATGWIGIDVDYRGNRDDFQRRCNLVIDALGHLGIPKDAILKSITPSGGRHYRFFTTRKVRVTDVPQLLAMVGLYESSGQIEIFPKLNKGMRLPFGYIPGRDHDPRKWLRFIRAYRRKKFPRVNWLDCMQRASQYANAELNGVAIPPSMNPVELIPEKPQCFDKRRRITRTCTLGIPRWQQTIQQDDIARYTELLSRPFANSSEATELWNLGICSAGTRIEATKRLAWHLLFVRRLSNMEAANKLVHWVYETGSETSSDVVTDNRNGTREVEEETRNIVQWMVANHISTEAPEQSLSHFSQDEVKTVLMTLSGAGGNEALVSVALSFLRFAKLHGTPVVDGWLVQISVNGVIRRWPGCGGMKYKQFVEALKASGLIEVTREKRQSSNGTGRPRTYLIRVQPELRTGATMSQTEAVELAAQSAHGGQATGMAILSSENILNTYRRSIPPTSSENMRKIQEEVGHETSHVENQSTALKSDSPDAKSTLNSFRQAEATRLAALFKPVTAPTPICTLTAIRSSSDIRKSSGPVDQMVTTVQMTAMDGGHGRWRRRFRRLHRPGQDVETTQISTSSDRSIVPTLNESQPLLRREFDEHFGRST